MENMKRRRVQKVSPQRQQWQKKKRNNDTNNGSDRLPSLVRERIVELLPPSYWLDVACVDKRYRDAVRVHWWRKNVDDNDVFDRRKKERADLLRLRFHLPTMFRQLPESGRVESREAVVRELLDKDFVHCLSYISDHHQRFNLVVNVFQSIDCTLELCCMTDSLDVFLWVSGEFPVESSLFENRYQMFGLACDYGSIRMVRYFFERFCTPLINRRRIAGKASSIDEKDDLDCWITHYQDSNVMLNGYLPVVRFIEERICLVRDRTTSLYFGFAILRGHMELFRYMVDKYKFTARDVDNVHYWMEEALENGHFAMVRFCMERFSHPNVNILLKRARKSHTMNTEQIVRYLELQRYSHPQEDISGSE
jgi:hypothetical protein